MSSTTEQQIHELDQERVDAAQRGYLRALAAQLLGPPDGPTTATTPKTTE